MNSPQKVLHHQLMRIQVLYRAAQELKDVEIVFARPKQFAPVHYTAVTQLVPVQDNVSWT